MTEVAEGEIKKPFWCWLGFHVWVHSGLDHRRCYYCKEEQVLEVVPSRLLASTALRWKKV